jgi:hypothetical protein
LADVVFRRVSYFVIEEVIVVVNITIDHLDELAARQELLLYYARNSGKAYVHEPDVPY